jgi:hypothetical protein
MMKPVTRSCKRIRPVPRLADQHSSRSTMLVFCGYGRTEKTTPKPGAESRICEIGEARVSWDVDLEHPPEHQIFLVYESVHYFNRISP